MKKINLIDAFLIIAGILFILLLPYLIYLLKIEVEHLNSINEDIKSLQNVTDEDLIRIYTSLFAIAKKKSIFNIVAQIIFLSIVSCSLALNCFAFVYLNPRLFRRSTYTDIKEKTAQEWAQNKSERLARKSAKAEADKQKRIEELQAELSALKKDDAPPPED